MKLNLLEQLRQKCSLRNHISILREAGAGMGEPFIARAFFGLDEALVTFEQLWI